MRYKGYSQLLIIVAAMMLLSGVLYIYKTFVDSKARHSVVNKDVSFSDASLDEKNTIPEIRYEPDTANWKVHENADLGIKIRYPDGWKIKTGTQYVPRATVLYTGQPKPQERSHSEEIVIGDYEVYSTSGGVCANTYCERFHQLRAKTYDELATFEIIKASWPDEKQDFMHFTSYAEGLDINKYPPVYFSYYSEERLKEILEILSTLETLQ